MNSQSLPNAPTTNVLLRWAETGARMEFAQVLSRRKRLTGLSRTLPKDPEASPWLPLTRGVTSATSSRSLLQLMSKPSLKSSLAKSLRQLSLLAPALSLSLSPAMRLRFLRPLSEHPHLTTPALLILKIWSEPSVHLIITNLLLLTHL